MEFKDFKIGQKFYTGNGKWIVLDVGIILVIAVKYNEYTSSSFDEYINYAAIFDHNDFGGCSLTHF